jgi:hypothetical protein
VFNIKSLYCDGIILRCEPPLAASLEGWEHERSWLVAPFEAFASLRHLRVTTINDT